MSLRLRLAPVVALLLLAGVLPGPVAAAAPPAYDVTYLGTGSPSAMSNTGVVVGTRLAGSVYEPLVSTNGSPWQLLPSIAGAGSVIPMDVNDAGVAVGVAWVAGNAIAVRWTPSAGGYTVAELPRLAGDASSYATAINDAGQVVGARRALGYVPAATSGWLYSDADGVVDLQARYGLDTVPTDINDAGVIISGVERLTLATGVRDDIGGGGPATHQPVTAVAINDAGRMAGSAATWSTSLPIVAAFRWEAGTWTYLAGTSRYTTVAGLNNLGDVTYGELGTGVVFDGLGAFPVGGLLSPAAAAAGWTITGSSAEIDDSRRIAATGRNTATGQTGGVLLTPTGTLQPPAAPALTGVAHPATPDAPWDAISLSWTTSAGASAYVLERRGPGQATFTEVTPAGGTIQRIYDDTAVTGGQAYTYRVFAVGLAGRSAASNEVTVVAPTAQPQDTTAPVARITAPKNGARVKGTVRVAASATDNVGVVRMELRTGTGTVLATATGSSLAYSWNTAGIPRNSSVTLVVWAFDAAGNRGSAQVTVRVSG